MRQSDRELLQQAAEGAVHHDNVLGGLIHERFVATLKSGETFEGLLTDMDDRVVVLEDAASMGDRGARIPVDGHLYLPREQVRYLQRP